MGHRPNLLLSGFSDETDQKKRAEQQFCAFAALGLKHVTLRFIDVGQGVKNIMQLSDEEVQQTKRLLTDYGLGVSSIGSPIGKIKLRDVDDGTSNRFVSFKQYLDVDVKRACDLACTFDSKLLRGFSFYHPKGDSPDEYISEVIDRLGEIAAVVDSYGLTYGLEVEANLVGQSGRILGRLYEAVDHPAVVLIFDGANLVCQGMKSDQVFEEYLAMKNGLGWIHIKDYRTPIERTAHVDEEKLNKFVPADCGNSGHEAILRDLAMSLPEIEDRMHARGVKGVFADLEPHVKGGGQFGGYSGPDGFGIALRSFCRVLDYVGIDYDLREFRDIV
jgi:sugar phosphate isomerase/epimerase